MSPPGQSRPDGRVVVLGNFDGVHRGHQAVAREAGELAAARGLEARLVTFHPHPSGVLGRGVPPLLTSRTRKRELVSRLRPPIELWEQTFDLAFAGQSAREFAESLVQVHQAEVVVVGADFRFGKGRAGDFAALVDLGRELGFTAQAHDLVEEAGGPISSTRVRNAVAEGRMEDATALLGRPHMMEGVVERGRRLGRTIGFPTLNLGAAAEMAPELGIYATLVDLVEPAATPGGEARVVALGRGATSVGTNPTVDSSGRRTVETYLFGGAGGPEQWQRELYDARIRVHLLARLRPEAKFDGLDPLVAQMRVDVDQARTLLASLQPDPATGAWF